MTAKIRLISIRKMLFRLLFWIAVHANVAEKFGAIDAPHRDLARSNHQAVTGATREVATPLYAAVVLALWGAQFNPQPHAVCEVNIAYVSDDACNTRRRNHVANTRSDTHTHTSHTHARTHTHIRDRK